ncbi:hypothetical protein DUNSADRAFT_9316 [Dunaliella salina]|uniref:G-patch domain-containing protein n=1 Tax=Dunaliella salina TaxID=3046 RepID=A0ABQ7GHP6_DUNSA|nr:hypothetical protein DUNSADRAFT_9316 [Dunaliella salina]|eukprot:KAF5834120.1 hypothetical protein DUNSADRAFT_9316 [Dunaliella salina]
MQFCLQAPLPQHSQDGTRSRVSRTDVVSEAWDGCSDLASDADDEDVDDEEGSDTSSSGSSSESGSDMDLYDAEGDDDGCQGRAALGLGADVGAAQHQYGRKSRKRPRQDVQEGDGEGGSVLGHVREAAEAGQLQDTKHFAQWEKHGRGVASRLMAKSGYTEGSGLGRRRTGIVDPVQALVLPKGQGLGLGSAGRSLGEDGEGSNTADGGPLKHKRRRGGERKRMAKHATAGREAREARHRHEDERSVRGGAPGLFGFLNQALGDNSSTAAKIRDHQAMFKHPADTTATTSSKSGGLLGQPPVGGGGKGGGKDSRAKEAGGADARARLMRQQGRVEHCQARVAHFQEMLQRNRANPSLASQIAQRLKDVQAELASEISEQARMSKNITGKDNQKKMMKF